MCLNIDFCLRPPCEPNNNKEECPTEAVEPSSACKLSDSNKICKWDDLECTCENSGTWLCLIPSNNKEECPIEPVEASSTCSLTDTKKVCKWGNECCENCETMETECSHSLECTCENDG